MSDFFTSLGFPAPEHRDNIRFYFAKALTYRARRDLILAFLAAGLVIQIVTMRVLPGLPFVLAAVLLGLVKGYDSRVRLKNFRNDQTWTEVSIEKVRQIEAVRRNMADWDRDSFDITNVRGSLVFLGFVVLGLFISFVLGAATRDARVSAIILVDFIVLVVPYYFTGVRWALKQGNLAVKVKLVLALQGYFEQHRIESESFVPMILLARDKDGGTVPVDLKFKILYKGLPPDRFYGLQGTVNINLVQGTSYPYFYCVLVAKLGFGLGKYKGNVEESKEVMCEYQQQADAEVLVVRHPTTKTSGYSTDDKASMKILSSAMAAARSIESEISAGR